MKSQPPDLGVGAVHGRLAAKAGPTTAAQFGTAWQTKQVEQDTTYQGSGADCPQLPLLRRARFRQQFMPGVGRGGSMNRRDVIKMLTGSSLMLVLPVRAHASLLKPGNSVSLRCLGKIRGPNYPNYLDGRTRDGSVGLAPKLTPKFSGTKWKVFTAGSGTISLQCLGVVDGPRWLDGRTANGSVGLAPNRNKPFTGTRWEVVEFEDGSVALKCLGDIDGPRWLDGRTGDGTVGLAPTTNPPFTGTKWEVRSYPVPID